MKTKIWRAILRYARARIDRDWMGSKPPEDWELICEELSNAKAALQKKLADPSVLYAHLAQHQPHLLVELLDGKAALLERMVVKPHAAGWRVHCFDADATEHTVLKDLSACSCPDSKFRRHECKHLKALKNWLT